MDGYSPTRDEVYALVRTAFSGVSREGGTSLHEARAIDDRETPTDQRAARALDTDLCWEGVPDEWFDPYASSLSFLDDVGFRYYLPAFMVHVLSHPRYKTGNAASALVFHLDALREHGHYYGRFKILRPEQRQAVAAFLAHMAAWNDTAQRIYFEFWHRFALVHPS